MFSTKTETKRERKKKRRCPSVAFLDYRRFIIAGPRKTQRDADDTVVKKKGEKRKGTWPFLPARERLEIVDLVYTGRD